MKGATDAGGARGTLLHAFQQGRAEESNVDSQATILLIDPLTTRELEVLKNICRKLEVHGRMQAVRRGRELKIL
jgi:hypothetical protein